MMPVLGDVPMTAGGGVTSSTSTCCTSWLAESRGREDGGVGVGDSLELPLGGAVEVPSGESAEEENQL